MPPEEPSCLVALCMEFEGELPVFRGKRVLAYANDVTTVSWYTATSEPPPGYESILDGLVFVRTSTIDRRAQIGRATPTRIRSTYHWKDCAQSDGLMIALALPPGHSISSCTPQLEEAKRFGHRVAVYWYMLPATAMDRRVTLGFSLDPFRDSVDDEIERLNRAAGLSRARPETADYDVALSFAGEDREYVQSLADALTSKGVKVFYDEFEQADLWGKDLYTHLVDIYGRRARFTVMFVSDAYRSKLWTNHERKAAQSKAFTQNSEYILPVRIDDTEIPGMLPTTGYVRASEKTPAQLASLLVEKLTRSPTR